MEFGQDADQRAWHPERGERYQESHKDVPEIVHGGRLERQAVEHGLQQPETDHDEERDEDGRHQPTKDADLHAGHGVTAITGR